MAEQNPSAHDAQDNTGSPTHSSTTISSTAVSSIVSQSTTVPAPAPIRAISSTEYGVSIFKFWQKKNGDLYMHNYWNAVQKNTAPVKLNLTMLAIENTPISSTAWQYRDYFVSFCLDQCACPF